MSDESFSSKEFIRWRANSQFWALVCVHFATHAIGIISWASSFGELFFFAHKKSMDLPTFFPWSSFFSFPDKPAVFVAYVLVSACLFLYALFYRSFLRIINVNGGVHGLNLSRWSILPFLISILLEITAIALFEIVYQTFKNTTRFALISIALLIVPVLWRSSRVSNLISSNIFEKTIRVFSNFALAFSMGLLFYAFAPLLTQEVRLLNDNIIVPEKTILRSGIVDNRTYISEHSIYGLHLGKTSSNPALRESYEMTAHDSPLLDGWLAQNRIGLFDKRESVLTFIQPLAPKEFVSLLSVLQPEDLAQAHRLYSLSHQEDGGRYYTPEENEFIDKNWLELKWQMLNRWAIHHHHFVFGPMNEFDLGRAPSKINFQYGFLNTVGILYLTKLIGGFTLEHYFVVNFSFYLVYLLILFGCAYLLLKDTRYVALVAVLSVASVLALDYEKIVRAPGLSPYRHLLDILVLTTAAWEWRRKQRFGAVLSYLGCLAEVALNKDFGVFLFCALLCVDLVRLIEGGVKKHWRELLTSAMATLSLLTLLIALHGISNSMSSYYEAGFASPPISDFIFYSFLGLFAIAYGTCFWPGLLDAELRYRFLFLVIYSNEVFLYYIWGVSPDHLLNLSPVYALTIAVGLKGVISISGSAKKNVENVVLILGQIVCILGVLLPAERHFARARSDFGQIFSTHVVHQWNFSRMHVLATADPKPFEHAVELIHKYEPARRGIYMISTLDNILPFLADRYSAMPYFDLAWFLLSDREFESAKSTINTEKPQYLFIDHDIAADHSGEVADPILPSDDNSVHAESILRIKRLEVLARFFREVAPDYEKIEESKLIDVYRRRIISRQTQILTRPAQTLAGL